ncbi:MAG TPA: GGDEF domain-containing protein [Tepidisphaeraceae bacterium]|nr:GGDEF domain-containing protein [Tepidisphaeraceae bacterium]
MNAALIEKIRQCPNLPSLPTIAMQVLNLAQRADVDIAEIARIISKDPALSGKILRTVNSSFYGRSQHVSTISQSLVILGLQSVKTLVLGFSLVTNLAKSKSKGFKHLTYWKRSVYAATASRTIAAKINLVQQEEVFLIALLMDIGMLVLDQVIGEEYGEIHAGLTSHGGLSAAEHAALGLTHADVSGMIAEQWKLPPILTEPMAKHHTPERVEDPALRKLTEVVEAASRCADVFVDDSAAGAIADVRARCMSQWSMTEADADALLNEIGTRTKEVASLFDINIGTAASYEAILKRANEALVEITLASQQQVSTLAEQNVKLKKAATTDALTGLANRATFDEFLATRFQEAMAGGAPISLLMLDIDKFKSVNDRFGHPTGDAVIRHVSKLLQSAARATDLAARYGGEEMTLVLPGTPRGVATGIAESIRRAIAANPSNVDSGKLPVTASIGVATFEPSGPLKSPAHLIKAADLAVYAAKKGGRNCVKVFSVPAPAAKPAA